VLAIVFTAGRMRRNCGRGEEEQAEPEEIPAGFDDLPVVPKGVFDWIKKDGT